MRYESTRLAKSEEQPSLSINLMRGVQKTIILGNLKGSDSDKQGFCGKGVDTISIFKTPALLLYLVRNSGLLKVHLPLHGLNQIQLKY